MYKIGVSCNNDLCNNDPERPMIAFLVTIVVKRNYECEDSPWKTVSQNRSEVQLSIVIIFNHCTHFFTRKHGNGRVFIIKIVSFKYMLFQN